MKRQKLMYKPIEGTLALIDGDILVWRIAATTQDVSENIALSRINKYLDDLLFNSGASDYIIYLTGDNNFRKHLYADYKANRKQEKPLHFVAIKQYLIKHEAAIVCEDEEADDRLGIEQMERRVLEDGEWSYKSLICSVDKDLKQVPGRHFDFVKNIHSFVTEDQGTYFFYQQLLTGDSTDNIPGLPKIGPVKAKKLLGEYVDEPTCKKKVLEAYQTILGMDEAAAKERINLIGKLLWIRKKEGELWEYGLKEG